MSKSDGWCSASAFNANHLFQPMQLAARPTAHAMRACQWQSRIERTTQIVTCCRWNIPRDGLEFRRFGDDGKRQIGQRQVVENTCMNSLCSGETKSSSPSPKCWSEHQACPHLPRSGTVAAQVVLVAGCMSFARTAVAVAKHRFADVALGDVDVFPLRHVTDAAPVHCTFHSLANLFCADVKTLAIAD
jgi:hypothetical protein